jgi:hypothetical protein
MSTFFEPKLRAFAFPATADQLFLFRKGAAALDFFGKAVAADAAAALDFFGKAVAADAAALDFLGEDS